LLEVTLPVVLFCAPAAVPVMFTTTVQEVAEAIVPPVKLMLPPPATAVTVPPHVPVNPFGVATTSPEGSVSENATPVRATTEFGLLMVKVRLVVPPNGIEAAPKLFVIDGGPATVTLAVDVLPVPPLVDVT
jgi:hypothetical protein